MNTLRGVALILVLACCCAAQTEDNVKLKREVKRQVEKINQALLKEDFATVADLTHPKIVTLMGGREKMTSAMTMTLGQMKKGGFAIESVKAEEPTDPVLGGAELYVVVPFLLGMKVPQGKVQQKSYVIGVSSDQGKTWSFVNGDLDADKIRQVLPDLPARLKLPAKQAPMLEKE